MELSDLSPASLDRLERALRRGGGARLHPGTRLPRGLRADEVIPLFDGLLPGRGGGDLAALLPPAARASPPPWRVTAIIPTHRQVPLGWRTLRGQDCRLEVLVLANGDFDARFGDGGVRVERVPWEGHGRTRQRGVAMSDADYLLYTVDDALPRGAGCVRAMVEALEAGGYDAVFGRQLPWPSSDPITRERLRAWTPPGTGHRRVERLDNVFALYRRQTLLEHPFPDVPIAEDLHWRRGRRIGYVPGAPVVHAHPRVPAELYRRTRDIHRQHIALGELPRVPDTAALLRALPGLLPPVLRAGPRELPCQLAELLGQWRAAQGSDPG